MEVDEAQDAVMKKEETVVERSSPIRDEIPAYASPSPMQQVTVVKSSSPLPVTDPEEPMEQIEPVNEQTHSPKRIVASRAPSTAIPDDQTQEKPAQPAELSRSDNVSEDFILSILRTSSHAEAPLPIARVDSQTKYVVAEQPSPAPPPPDFAFDVDTSSADPADERKHTVKPAETQFKALTYNLPPLKALPMEYNRKGKVKQSKKREKDKADGKSQEWQPLGMAKWSAMLRANPVHKKVAKASKCLSTRDWNASNLQCLDCCL